MTSIATTVNAAKQCAACRVDHPVSSFGRDSSTGDGLKARCRRSRNAERHAARMAVNSESMDSVAHAIATGWFPSPLEPRVPLWPEPAEEAGRTVKEFNRLSGSRPCVSAPNLFFSDAPQDVEAARSECSRCPVAWECLILALTQDEEFGVWGGMSSEERRSFKEAIGR